MDSSMKTENISATADSKINCDFEVLRRSPVFSGADTEVVKLFAYLAKRKKYKPGEYILTKGKGAIEAYYLISGSAEVTTIHHGNEVVLQHINHNTFFGELALLARFNWFFNVRSVTESEVLMISRESFGKVLEKYPEKREKMVEKIVQLRVERLEEQTTFLLDTLPESLLSKCGDSSLNVSL